MLDKKNQAGFPGFPPPPAIRLAAQRLPDNHLPSLTAQYPDDWPPQCSIHKPPHHTHANSTPDHCISPHAPHSPQYIQEEVTTSPSPSSLIPRIARPGQGPGPAQPRGCRCAAANGCARSASEHCATGRQAGPRLRCGRATDGKGTASSRAVFHRCRRSLACLYR